MAYTNSNPVARKEFTFAPALVLNVKLFLVTGFEFVYIVTAFYFTFFSNLVNQ